MRPVRIGCSGWVYRDWRGTFYPEGLPQRAWLQHYATRFDTVEVNNTFYRLPTVKAVTGWVEQTPEHFVFAVKVSRYLTHIKRLTQLERGLELFYERLAPLVEAGKLGPVLWQLPESFHRDDERLRGALEAIAGRPGRHAFEFRHPSWFTAPVYAMLRAHDVPLVVADDRRRPFATREITAGWTYVRFHWGGGRRGNYSRADHGRWKRRIAAWRARTEVWAFFNNDWETFAPRNAQALARSLSPPFASGWANDRGKPAP